MAILLSGKPYEMKAHSTNLYNSLRYDFWITYTLLLPACETCLWENINVLKEKVEGGEEKEERERKERETMEQTGNFSVIFPIQEPGLPKNKLLKDTL